MLYDAVVVVACFVPGAPVLWVIFQMDENKPWTLRHAIARRRKGKSHD